MSIRSILAAVCLAVAVTGAARAEGVRFIVGSWNEARALARAENKMILVDAYTDWCGWCKVMDKNTFSDASVGAFVNERFVSVKIDMEKGIGITLAMRYRVWGFPTFLFFRPDGRLVYRSFGYEPPKDFLVTLNKAVDPAFQTAEPGDPDKLELDWPQFYRDAFAEGDDRRFPKPEEVGTWLDTQDNPLSEVGWAVLSRFDATPEWQDFVLTRADAIGRRFGHAEVDSKVSGILADRVLAAAKDSNRAAFDATLRQARRTLRPDQLDDYLPWLRRMWFEETRAWSGFADEIDSLRARANAAERVSTINDAAWKLYEECDDAPVLERATAWMKDVVVLAPEYAYLDTYAALLFKTGRYGEAERWAKRAIDTGKKAGNKVGDTEALLEKIRAAQKNAKKK